MINSFGVFARKLRLERSEFLFDMAKRLNVSSAFLSAVETGKKSIPKNFAEKIIKIYELTKEQVNDLYKSIEDSVQELKIPLKDKTKNDRELLLKFARTFEEFDEEDKKIMANLLNKRGEDNELYS